MGDLIKQILSIPIQLADQVIKSSEEASSFKNECYDLKTKTTKLSELLRQAARSSSDLYERPTRRIMEDTSQVLEKAISLAHKCRPNGLIKRAFTIIPQTAFKKMLAQIDNSIGDVSWLLRVSGSNVDDGDDGDEDGVGGYLGLPPIATNEPILCLIWEQISILQIGSFDNRAEAAGSLVSLARDNDRNGKLIIEEGGIVPLLKLVKEGKTVESQENAVRAIGLLGRDSESIEHMLHCGVSTVFSKMLKDGPMRVQAMVAWAVSELVLRYPKCQDVFAQQNVVRLLVGHLAFETVQEHSKYSVATNKMAVAVAVANASAKDGKMSVEDDDQTLITHPLGKTKTKLVNVVTSVQEQAKANVSNSNGLSVGGNRTREREMESPETKANMKAMAARALWYLAKGNSSICKSICESRALLCLAVLLEKGVELIQYNSAMALMEITSVAETDADLRRSAFKPNSPACKAVVEQLLKVIEKADSDSELLIPCIKAIGNLARTFKATETRMIGPLVMLLDETEPKVSREACIALAKFAGSDNYLHVDHSKAIIDASGIKHLVQLVYFGEQPAQIPAVVLLSYIAVHVPDSEELAKSEVLKVLEWASKQAHVVHDESRETLLIDAKSRLELYQSRI